ncbi:toprim domain-containing protein [Mycoplasma sp. 480]|uniref:toprim domain-containing protein n=1 Tax=Mycoplasma sp. 480 TaxID=3440155 RepID=UPI003F517251
MIGSEFNELVENLKKIPGITKKQAEKIAFYTLNLNYEELEKLLNSFKQLNQNLNKCISCNFISKNKQCDICLDEKREKKLLIIESDNELLKIEQSDFYKGKYFIFDIKNKENYQLEIEKILSFSSQFQEIIIALSPTIDGLKLTNLIHKNLKEKTKKIIISQIAFGIPMGASLDYMDIITIKESINNRKE